MNKTLRTLSTAAALVLAGAAALTASAAKSGADKAADTKGKTKQVNPSNAANSSEIRLSASAGTVAYYSNGKFKAAYRERITSSQVTQKFKFEVEAFTPNADVPVLLNGVQVATAVVNATGGGEFEFASFDNNPGDEQPLPSGFPRLRAGDTITIGNLTATFR